jgi:hypothetical protein
MTIPGTASSPPWCPRASGRAVCLALVRAMREYGIPEEILSDNGKQFTDRFGKGGEVLFDRICRDNGIHPPPDAPASPTTTGKVCEDLARRGTGSGLTLVKV